MIWLTRTLGKSEKKRAGFTLVELMIVVIVVGILAAAAIPIYWWAMAKAYSSEGKALLGAVRSVEQIYFAEYDAWQVLSAPYVDDDALEADIGIKAHHNKWWHADLLDYTTTDPSPGLGTSTTWIVADGTNSTLTAIDDIIIALGLEKGEFLVSYDQDKPAPTWKAE